MASGFIILKDGRCLSRRWTHYDYLIELAIKELSSMKGKKAEDFKGWLQTLIPQEGDEYNGYGGFIRKANGENVQRWLDLRELTTENQQLFWDSIQNTLSNLITKDKLHKDNENLISLLKRFLKMKHLVDIGDNPDNLSDWVKGYIEPPSGKRSGPGW